MTKIEQQVMASVLVVYIARKLVSLQALELYALALSAAGIASLVSVPHVVANFSAIAGGGLGGVSTFVLAAILNTKFAVQVALFIGGIALVALLVDTARSVRGGAVAARA